MTSEPGVEAVFWDFGGVLTTSPFDAFNRYEREHGLPRDFIRRINATNPDGNAWARLERGEIDRAAFGPRFEAEAAAAGQPLSGRVVLDLIKGDIQTEMVDALSVIAGRYKTACLTNNFHDPDTGAVENTAFAEVAVLFDRVFESRHLGVRKPEPTFYRMACEAMAVAPANVVFLDDLGVNLKPARAMGMRTIKVGAPGPALDALEGHLGHSVR